MSSQPPSESALGSATLLVHTAAKRLLECSAVHKARISGLPPEQGCLENHTGIVKRGTAHWVSKCWWHVEQQKMLWLG